MFPVCNNFCIAQAISIIIIGRVGLLLIVLKVFYLRIIMDIPGFHYYLYRAGNVHYYFRARWSFISYFYARYFYFVLSIDIIWLLLWGGVSTKPRKTIEGGICGARDNNNGRSRFAIILASRKQCPLLFSGALVFC